MIFGLLVAAVIFWLAGIADRRRRRKLRRLEAAATWVVEEWFLLQADAQISDGWAPSRGLPASLDNLTEEVNE